MSGEIRFSKESGIKSSFTLFTLNIYAIFNDQSFNDTLTNDIVSFEQLGPGHLTLYRTWPHIKTNLFDYLLLCLKQLDEYKQCRP